MGAGSRARRASENAAEAAVSAVGQDDLDVDGNWSFGGAGDVVGEPEAGDAAAARPTPRKRKASGAKLGKPAKASKIAKIAGRAATAADDAGEDDLGGFATAAAAKDDERDAKTKRKKKRKKQNKKPRKQRVSAAEAAAARGLDSCGQARARLAEAWVVEAESCSLSKLETRDVTPQVSWFWPCPSDAPLARLPWCLSEKPLPGTIFGALQACAAAPPTRRKCSIGVTVLCLSTDRVFDALAELGSAWKVGEAWAAKPLALAAHGGGRRKDQVARQAKAIAAGVSVAVGTPGRVLRLLEEKHLEVSGLETIVVDLARDRKERDVLTLPETRRDFFALCRRFLSAELRRVGGSCRLVMCGAPAPKGP